MKTNISIYVMLSLLAVCSMSCSNHSTERVKFTDLDKSIQDTLLYYTEHHLSIEYDLDDLINFSNDYEVIVKQDKLMAWVYHSSIKNIKNGKQYKISKNAAIPLIIKDGYLYIPEEDDILLSDTINECFFQKIRLP